MKTYTGTVKWFKGGDGPGCGYGFIEVTPALRQALGLTRDLFVHISGIKDRSRNPHLEAGQQVEFTIDQRPNDTRAANVVVTRRAPADEPLGRLHD